MTDFSEQREKMVEYQIVARGITTENVVAAMRSVPRERFVGKSLAEFAYDDGPMPIGAGQTISQPYVVALMVQALALRGGETVLEIGTGSGYSAAVLAEIAGDVYTIERIGELAEHARSILDELGYENVHVMQGDGTLGWPEHAPFDGIVVTAGGPEVPESLQEQLKVGGRMIIPVGTHEGYQELVRVIRVADSDFERDYLGGVRFVPLVGEQGWTA